MNKETETNLGLALSVVLETLEDYLMNDNLYNFTMLYHSYLNYKMLLQMPEQKEGTINDF